MKKMIMAVAIVCAAAFANAASVGWAVTTGSTSYAGDAYNFFIIGQNGVTSAAQITALLDAGKSVGDYVYGSGTLAANGAGQVQATASGKSLGAGSYESFAILFDSATPTVGESKYVLISGLANQTKVVSSTAASVMFSTGSAASIVNNSANWQSFGSVPEPTSGLLLLLGMAGLALKRKVA